MKFIQIKNEEDRTQLHDVIVQGQLQLQSEAESAVLVQLYSAKCLETYIWHWTISSVKHVPCCNPSYLISIIYCQQWSICLCGIQQMHCSLIFANQSSFAEERTNFLGPSFLGMFIGHPDSEEEVSCLR